MGFFATLGASVVGGLIALGGNVLFERVRAGAQARHLATALRAAIAAVLSVVERRRYKQFLREIEKRMDRKLEDGRHAATIPADEVPVAAVSFSFFDVFEANLGNLGLLGDTAGPVVEFYAPAKSF